MMPYSRLTAKEPEFRPARLASRLNDGQVKDKNMDFLIGLTVLLFTSSFLGMALVTGNREVERWRICLCTHSLCFWPKITVTPSESGYEARCAEYPQALAIGRTPREAEWELYDAILAVAELDEI